MKSIIVFASFLLSTGMLHSQQSKQYKIQVKIRDGIQEGKAFVRYWGSNGPQFDSAIFNKGKTEIVGKLPDKPTIARLYILGKNETEPRNENTSEVWLENGETEIIADTELRNAKYSGSQLQVQFNELQQILKSNKEKEQAINATYKKADQDNNNLVKDKLVNEDYPALFREKQKILGGFILKYPSSLLSAVILDDFAGDGEMDLAIVEPVYNGLDPALKSLPIVEKVAKRIAINKLTAPGMPALAFSQSDTSGRQIHLSAFNGKYLLIDFWAGWCMPCRAENPLLRTLYAKYKEKGFEILGVSFDGERKRWTNAIIDDKLTWPQVSDLNIFDNAVAKQYGITSIPQNLLIGPDGKIIAKNLRGSALENKLGNIFK